MPALRGPSPAKTRARDAECARRRAARLGPTRRRREQPSDGFVGFRRQTGQPPRPVLRSESEAAPLGRQDRDRHNKLREQPQKTPQTIASRVRIFSGAGRTGTGRGREGRAKRRAGGPARPLSAGRRVGSVPFDPAGRPASAGFAAVLFDSLKQQSWTRGLIRLGGPRAPASPPSPPPKGVWRPSRCRRTAAGGGALPAQLGA